MQQAPLVGAFLVVACLEVALTVVLAALVQDLLLLGRCAYLPLRFIASFALPAVCCWSVLTGFNLGDLLCWVVLSLLLAALLFLAAALKSLSAACVSSFV